MLRCLVKLFHVTILLYDVTFLISVESMLVYFCAELESTLSYFFNNYED